MQTKIEGASQFASDDGAVAYAVIQHGAALVRTVADSAIAAKVNWLHPSRLIVLSGMNEKFIDAAFQRYAEAEGARVSKVIVREVQ